MGEHLRRGGSINIFRFIKTLVLFKEGYQNGSTIRLSSHLGDVSGCLVQIKFCLQLYLIKHTDGCPDGKHQLNLQFVHFINFDRGTTKNILCFNQTWFNLECYLLIPLCTDEVGLSVC